MSLPFDTGILVKRSVDVHGQLIRPRFPVALLSTGVARWFERQQLISHTPFTADGEKHVRR